jgi:hypothetical protein
MSRRLLLELQGFSAVLEDLSRFLQQASFGPTELGMERCIDDGLREALLPLLGVPGFATHVFSPLSSPSSAKQTEREQRRYCNVLRVRGPAAILFASQSADFISVKVWGETPYLHGLSFPPGLLIHVSNVVNLETKEGTVMDLLIMK